MKIDVELSLFMFEKPEFDRIEDQVPTSVIDAVRLEVLRTQIRAVVAKVREFTGVDRPWEDVEFAELTSIQEYSFPLSPDQPVSDQFQFLLSSQGLLNPSGGWAHKMVFDLPEGRITVLIGNGAYEFGSFHIKELLKFDVEDFRTIRNSTIAILLATAIAAGGTMVVESGTANELQYNTYTCSTMGSLSGSQWDIEELVVDDLIIHDDDTDDVKRSVIAARQSCLAAAGYNTGPIDGIDGLMTKGAASQFAIDQGNIRVDWNSRVFLRHLVQAAIKHQRQ